MRMPAPWQAKTVLSHLKVQIKRSLLMPTKQDVLPHSSLAQRIRISSLSSWTSTLTLIRSSEVKLNAILRRRPAVLQIRPKRGLWSTTLSMLRLSHRNESESSNQNSMSSHPLPPRLPLPFKLRWPRLIPLSRSSRCRLSWLTGTPGEETRPVPLRLSPRQDLKLRLSRRRRRRDVS